jgi:membrane protease YdiL (CAAX protease family)
MQALAFCEQRHEIKHRQVTQSLNGITRDREILLMKKTDTSKREWGERILLAILFIAIGSIIMIVFSPWRPTLGRANDYLGRIGLIISLSVLVMVVRRSRHYEKYWHVIYGLLVLTIAVSLNWIIANYLIYQVGVGDTTPAGWALQKLNEGLVVISVVVLMTKLSGSSLGSIYIQKGNLKQGLIIGLTTFILAALGSIPMATLFNAQDLTLDRIIPWIPWILIFVLVNGAMEEIMFRGLFLRKVEPFYGKFISNLMVAVVFTVIHRAATYTTDPVLFLVILFPLALAWGYVMQKTEAVWGSILFHAGMDIPIILGIFSSQF